MIRVLTGGLVGAATASVEVPDLLSRVDFLQFGALGVLMVVLVLIYRIVSQFIDTKLRSAPATYQPPPSVGDMSYNEQLARLVYDTSKSLSEVAVTQTKTLEVLRDMGQRQDHHVDMMQDHVNDTRTFIRDYKKQIVGIK